jgi:hypothetical protein
VPWNSREGHQGVSSTERIQIAAAETDHADLITTDYSDRRPIPDWLCLGMPRFFEHKCVQITVLTANVWVRVSQNIEVGVS